VQRAVLAVIAGPLYGDRAVLTRNHQVWMERLFQSTLRTLDGYEIAVRDRQLDAARYGDGFATNS
jgi:hypothetical protein